MINKAVSDAGIRNLKKEAFFILNEFCANLLTDDEREAFKKLKASIESRS